MLIRLNLGAGLLKFRKVILIRTHITALSMQQYNTHSFFLFLMFKDVMQAVHTFVSNLNYDIPPLSLFSLLVATIIHDYGHPGVNNNFLYRIMDPIAIQFNGISVHIIR